MTVICYTFTTSDSPCFIIGFPSSQGKHRTSGCMLMAVLEVSFISSNYIGGCTGALGGGVVWWCSVV